MLASLHGNKHRILQPPEFFAAPRSASMNRRRSILACTAFVAALVLFACASPVGIRTSDPREVQRYLTRNALTDDHASDFTLNELRRYDLLDRFEEQPVVALANLHGAARAEGFPPAALFALAELSFLHAERTKLQSGHAATLIYAWALLFPENRPTPHDTLDPRLREAADLYNRALTAAFRRTEKGLISIPTDGPRVLPLPFGSVEVSAKPDLLVVEGTEYYDLRAVTELHVSGLRNRYRRPGIGAPLAAHARPVGGLPAVVDRDPSDLVPMTAVAVIEEPLAGLETGRLRARIELFTSLDAESVELDGRRYSLESEPTAALAASLAESRFWESEMRTFLGNAVGLRRASALKGIRPYVKGRIPVVFVHGTASSPARWADMINDLLADPRLRERYAYWTFTYDSGNPIAYSGWQLREALAQAARRADPDGRDPCVQDMVVMGHSQGGLLTKLTTIDSGDRFWSNISDRDFESTTLPESTKDTLRQTLFLEPLPFVRRVVFLATPHRGSYLAGPQIVRRLAERFVRLPSDVVRVGVDVLTLVPRGEIDVTFERIPTSIDNMSPGNRYIQTLSAIPVSDDVTAHSIVAVEDLAIPLEAADDGVVRYASAHLEGVASEAIVQSPHSGMQAASGTIEEVRRILLEHSRASRCPIPSR
jgi:pimeloyl-ACP methyl ester carboxylesterase